MYNPTKLLFCKPNCVTCYIMRFTIPKNFPARKERTDYFESMRSSKLCYPMDYPPMKL